MAQDHTSLDDRFTVEGCYKAAKDKTQKAHSVIDRKYAQKAAVERYVQMALEVRRRNPPGAIRHPLLARAYRAKQAQASQLYVLLRAKQQAMANSHDSVETHKLRLEITHMWVQLRDIYRELLNNTTSSECVAALLHSLARAELNINPDEFMKE